MNKKLLFATMSLAALTACTNDDFESKNVAQEVSPIQFEVINDNEAMTRASMTGNDAGTVIKWSAADGDLFTLYHGATAAGYTTGYENATYKATANPGSAATLTTPSMIKQGHAIMVWPVDTTFRYNVDNKLTVSIPVIQENIENNIPYVSDLINIGAYLPYSETVPAGSPAGTQPTAYNRAGKDRKYPVFMRPMASQLIVHADYVSTDNDIKTLYKGGSAGLSDAEAIAEIDVKSVELHTAAGGGNEFTTKVPLKFETINDFETANPTITLQGTVAAPGQWRAAAPYNAWDHVTEFDMTPAGLTSVAALTSKCVTGIESCKFLILPQARIASNPAAAGDAGVAGAEVVVNTRYGKVTIYDIGAAAPNKKDYTNEEYARAWYRYVADPTTDAEVYEGAPATTATTGLGYKTSTNIAKGMMQVLDAFSAYKYKDGVAKGEPVGAAGNRWVEVRLNHLDMDGLHVDNDKWLRDAARVWKKYGLESATIRLDGTAGEFEISQNTIDVINEVNATATGGKYFYVTPCNTAGEVCNTIVITGGGNIKDLTFIKNTVATAAVALKAGETWKWSASSNNTVKISADGVPAGVNTGITKIINRGTFESDATATIKVAKDDGTANGAYFNLPFENAKGATWNISAGKILNVQFDVTNYGTVYIPAGAQYRQDGNAGNTKFINEAKAKPGRFNRDAVAGDDTQIGLVDNYGVFATVSPAAAPGSTKGRIYNYGLIEHRTADAKTYITHNMTENADAGYGADATFANAFDATAGNENKMGRINLTYGNKDEDNISISANAGEGFVSVTVTTADAPADGVLGSTSAAPAPSLGAFVNYIIIKSGVNQIAKLNAQYKYVEIDTDHEVEWSLPSTSPNATYEGLMILSPVNIKLGTTINVNGAGASTYLGADIFVAGTFNHGGKWNGYYGNTAGNVATHYITF